MAESSIYSDIAVRTDGAFLLGVVGPVRTGKSSFIKRFMETLVIPHIENTYMRERARDELPQSGSGRTIMTAEPKFVPENAVSILLGGDTELSVRLVDCVGYMVEGAAGQQEEDGGERMVTTPWFDHEVTLTEAAEKGTHKVITEHSTVGIVVTTDGSICDLPRRAYEESEARVIQELKSIGKPFVVLLNCTEPKSENAGALAARIAADYGVRCLPVNCLTMTESDIVEIIRSVLEEFPLKSLGVFLPDWLDALPEDNALRQQLFREIRDAAYSAEHIRDCRAVLEALQQSDAVEGVMLEKNDLSAGAAAIRICLPRALYYQTISEQTGIEIRSDGDLISTLSEMSSIKLDYDRLRSALEQVRSRGYGVVVPDSSEMELEEPQIVRQGGKYSVKLKASAPAIHMMMTRVETEVTPAIGGETASEEIINFLLQGFEGDVNRIWESNIFGKSLNDIAEEGLSAKLEALPENVKEKLRETLERIINEGSGGLICILL
ncbi:MAG: stage IV sporulation protein A [Oscillospiraceae bacterium]|nr:stage IV sporulation protein A [Oscillospiraceae bacterium]